VEFPPLLKSVPAFELDVLRIEFDRMANDLAKILRRGNSRAKGE